MSIEIYPCPEGHADMVVSSRQIAPGREVISAGPLTLYRVECLAGRAAQCWKGGEELSREEAVYAWNSVMDPNSAWRHAPRKRRKRVYPEFNPRDVAILGGDPSL